jgi:hypothetical protein
MSHSTGPRLWCSCEAVVACISNKKKSGSLRNRFSTVHDEDERVWQLREFCTPLLEAVQLPEDHFTSLDAHFTTLIPEALEDYPGKSSLSGALPENRETRAVQEILRRLPSLPQRMLALPLFSGLRRGTGTLWERMRDGRWASKYILPDARHHFRLQELDNSESILNSLLSLQDLAWENLYVTTYMDTNSIVLATKIAWQGSIADFEFAQSLLQYLNVLANLIDEFEILNTNASLLIMEPYSDPDPSVKALKAVLFPEIDDDHKQGRDILRVFLWAAWQRSVMLYFYYLLQVQLQHGYSPEWASLYAIQGMERLSELDSQSYRGNGIDYMCNWAFQVLRISRSSLCLDFRTMLSRFDSHFGQRPGRCIKGSDLACEGDLPDSCQRFTGAETKSQSIHALHCNGACRRIVWSEDSYKRIEGARAVCFQGSSNDLQYRQASSRTMAISHVWSHGQGGRPEQGINACLHQQYSALAKSCNCDSYWIDSTCIPSDPQLRKEAIETINSVFITSQVVMISDKDLQSVDLSNPNIQSLETLLSILLVSDWNVRAWTMLEAIRGRKNVHLLCKGGEIISLMTLFSKVLNEGAVDLAVLLGSAQHLLPSSNPSAALSIEDAGFLLSQRHASRPSDEVVIWGLLNNLPGNKSALNLWKSQEIVRTGYLMSSTARINCSGYHWAPNAPYIRPYIRTVSLDNEQQQQYLVCYQSYDGQGSYVASIKSGGLQGKWLVRDIDLGVLAKYRDDFCYKTPLGPGHPTQQEHNPHLDPTVEVYEQPDTANACNIIDGFLRSKSKVRVVRPLADCGTVPYLGGEGRGESYGTIAAICVSALGSQDWEWQGVHQWLDESDDYYWRIESMMIS